MPRSVYDKHDSELIADMAWQGCPNNGEEDSPCHIRSEVEHETELHRMADDGCPLHGDEYARTYETSNVTPQRNLGCASTDGEESDTDRRPHHIARRHRLMNVVECMSLCAGYAGFTFAVVLRETGDGTRALQWAAAGGVMKSVWAWVNRWFWRR